MAHDLTLLKQTPWWKDNPDFMITAVELGNVVTCFSCGKVVGIGWSKAAAEDDAAKSSLGVFLRGNWFCTEDAKSDDHPPVPAGLQKHKSPQTSPRRRS